jgi:predicted  nucleic acid-binding Zn-ribbon protein
MPSPLVALLAVQDLDTAIDQTRHRLAHLPEAEALAAVQAERAMLGKQRVEHAARRDEVADLQRRLEAELEATEQRMRSLSERLYGGNVSASRDLQALSAEVDALRARSSSLEDELLAVLEAREPLDSGLDALDAADVAAAAVEERHRAELATTSETLEAEIAELAARRRALAEAVPGELMASYEHLRQRLGGVGAARLVAGRCEGCHLQLPATELDRIRHLPEETVVTCDQCGRILVRA